MAAKKNEPEVDVEEAIAPTGEDRIDDRGIESFGLLGYSGRLPDTVVATYKEFKRRKDKIHPGPVSPEGIVTILFLAGLVSKEK